MALRSAILRVAGVFAAKNSFFPTGRYVNAESPAGWCVRFIAADFACGFVHGPIQGVAVNSGGAGVHPNFGRMNQPDDGLAEQASRSRSGFFDFAPVGFVVATVDVAAGEIQYEVGVLKFFGPAG